MWMKSTIRVWSDSLITLLALFVPWEQFMAIDKLQGYTHSDSGLASVNTVWLQHLQHLPDRIKAIYANVKLLRKSAEDAKKDALLWALYEIDQRLRILRGFQDRDFDGL